MDLPFDQEKQPFLPKLQTRKDDLLIQPQRSNSVPVLSSRLRITEGLYRRPLSAVLKPIMETEQELAPYEKPSSYIDAVKTLFFNTIPLVIIYFAIFSTRNLSLHFIKERNNSSLTSAIGVGNTLLNVVGLSVFMSLNAGLISRSAQAFGAKNKQLVGFYLHRAFIINAIALIPGICLLYWADTVCIWVGFDVETSRHIQKMTSNCIIGVYAMMIYHTLTSYLYSCDIFRPSSIVLITSSVVFAILSYILFKETDMDIMAVAISFNVMHILNALLIFLYILIKNPVPGTFFWFKKQSFKDVWDLFVHEFFVGSMVFLEWICYEIIFLFAGGLTLTELSSLTIVFTNFQTLYAVPVSLADTVLAFVGNAMGEGDIKKAKNFLKAGVTLSAISLVFVELFYILLNKDVALFYSNDLNVVEESMKLFRVYLLYYPPDFIQIIFSAGLRAIGKEKLGSVMFFVCYYIIAIPLAYILSFPVGWRDLGIVYGPMIGIYILLIWLLFVYWRIDWDKRVEEIAEKIKKDDEALLEDSIDFDQTLGLRLERRKSSLV